MPWHHDENPTVNYKTGKVAVKNYELLAANRNESKFTITNLLVKKYRSMSRKKETTNGGDLELYQLIEKSKMNSDTKHNDDPRTTALLKEFDLLFREDLPDGLPPSRAVEHGIENEPGSQPPNRPLNQLSPAELLGVNEY